jgi:hypothetical protein
LGDLTTGLRDLVDNLWITCGVTEKAAGQAL